MGATPADRIRRECKIYGQLNLHKREGDRRGFASDQGPHGEQMEDLAKRKGTGTGGNGGAKGF